MSERIPAEAFHPSEFIQDEMDARGWTRDYLASQMTGEFGLNRVGLDFYFGVHDRGLVMGEAAICDFARIFGTSEDLFRNLEKTWIAHPSSAIPTTAPDVRLVKRKGGASP